MAKVNSFLLDLDTAQQFHNTVKDRLEDDGYITVTSPMELTKVNLDGGSAAQANIVRQSETNLFTSLGMAKELLDSDDAGNIGLERSIQVDENYMFVCYRMFERFMNFILLTVTGKNSFQFSFLNVTNFNKKDKFAEYLLGAQYGMPTLYMAMSSLGVEMKDVDSMVWYENVTDIKSQLMPLVSSFTANSNDLMNTGGAPKKKTTELSDTQVNQINKGTADKRTQ